MEIGDSYSHRNRRSLQPSKSEIPTAILIGLPMASESGHHRGHRDRTYGLGIGTSPRPSRSQIPTASESRHQPRPSKSEIPTAILIGDSYAIQVGASYSLGIGASPPPSVSGPPWPAKS